MKAQNLLYGVLIALFLTSFATSSACGKKEVTNEVARSYVLVLTDTTSNHHPWLTALRKSPQSTVAVSGKSGETATELLQRLPWLLQPGVDTVIYDTQFAGAELVEPLREKLEKLSSFTVLVVK